MEITELEWMGLFMGGGHPLAKYAGQEEDSPLQDVGLWYKDK